MPSVPGVSCSLHHLPQPAAHPAEQPGAVGSVDRLWPAVADAVLHETHGRGINGAGHGIAELLPTRGPAPVARGRGGGEMAPTPGEGPRSPRAPRRQPPPGWGPPRRCRPAPPPVPAPPASAPPRPTPGVPAPILPIPAR